MRVEYDPQANAAYIYFTDAELAPGLDMVPLESPTGVQAMLNMDWKDGKIVGLEVLGAAELLHPDFLAQATLPGGASTDLHRAGDQHTNERPEGRDQRNERGPGD